MKRTLNSVYPLRLFRLEKLRSLPALRAFHSAFLFLPISFAIFFPFDSPSYFNHGAAKHTIVFTVSVWESTSREKEWSMASITVPGPMKADCGKIRLGKRLAYRRLGRTCSPLLAGNPTGSEIKLRRLFRQNCYECCYKCNRTHAVASGLCFVFLERKTTRQHCLTKGFW